MTRYLLFTLLLTFGHNYGQQKQGAIKTEKGFLLFFNQGSNTHTLNLEGDVELKYYPVIKKDELTFQFITDDKKEFGKDSKSALQAYMQWEREFYEEQFNTKLKPNSETIVHNGITMNFLGISCAANKE